MRITIGKKLFLGFAIVLTLMVIMGSIAYHSLGVVKRSTESVKAISYKSERLSTLTTKIYDILLINDVVTGGNIGLYDYLRPMADLVNEELKEIEKLDFNDSQREIFKSIKANFLNLMEATKELIKLEDPVKGAVAVELIENADLAATNLIDNMDSFQKLLEEEKSKTVVLAEHAEKTGILTVISVSLLAIISSLGIGFIITRSITTKLYLLTTATERVAKGDLTISTDVKSNDEIGDLSNSFNKMLRDLRESRAQLVDKDYVESIIANTIDTLIVFDAEGRIKTVNRATLDLLGYTKEELIGQPVENIFAKGRYSFKEIILHRLLEEGFIRNYEIPYKTKHNKLIPMLFSGALMRGKSRELIGIVVIAKDITERKRTEKELETAYMKLKETQSQLIQAEKMSAVGRLASGIAHEVKNPLAVILTGLQYLPRALGDRQKTSQVLKEMITAVQRADTVVRGLLDFTRTWKLEITTESLNSLLYNSLLLLEKQMDKNKISVITDYSKDTPYVDVDVDKMDQVFTNLFMNAIHAMPDGGRLTVKTYKRKLMECGKNVGRRSGDMFRLKETVVITEIEDTGSGIPEDALGKIFEPFFTTRRSKGGTGLGLPIVKNIIDMHNGAIYIENKKEGRGARVTVILKVHNKDAKT